MLIFKKKNHPTLSMEVMGKELHYGNKDGRSDHGVRHISPIQMVGLVTAQVKGLRKL